MAVGFFLGPLRQVVVNATRSRIGPLDEASIPLRVMPWDCDLNVHLTNSRYLYAMDLGRWALVVRSGMLPHLLQRGWNPILVGARLRFRRSLDLFDRYEVVTRVAGWDDRYLLFEQRFEKDGEVAAVGHVRAQVRGRKGAVDPSRLMALVAGGPIESPPLSEGLRRWVEADRYLRRNPETEISLH